MTKVRAPKLKRVYEPAARTDGARVLVDRIWPRGVSKAAAELTLWLKDVAPSTALRKWFGHRPERWVEFRRRYRAELDANEASISLLRELMLAGPMTLLYGAHDEEHNQAVVLAERVGGAGPRGDG
ncbi:MAG: DUF488 domain-containing protein [Polyangia bacterium]